MQFARCADLLDRRWLMLVTDDVTYVAHFRKAAVVAERSPALGNWLGSTGSRGAIHPAGTHAWNLIRVRLAACAGESSEGEILHRPRVLKWSGGQ